MKKLLILLLISITILSVNFNTKIVKADELQDNINTQIEKLDLSELEKFLSSISGLPDNVNLFDYIGKILKGEYDSDTKTVFNYILNILSVNIKTLFPLFISIIGICFICGILKNLRCSFSEKGVSDVIYFVSLISILILLSTSVVKFFIITKNTIENIAKLTEIMSPIIITLMMTTGGVSASIYKPAVAFLSTGFISIMLNIILPLVMVIYIFSIIGNLSEYIKLDKFVQVSESIIKWIIGITVTVFGLFLSIQGITSATYDGISMKAMKYAISNSIPLIGGFLRDGFDIVVAGSILIKNSIGLVTLFALFYIIISPVIQIAVFSLALKIVAGFIEPVYDKKIADFCVTLSKSLSYLIVCLLAVGFMLFVTILLMIFSANAFI